MYLGHDLNCNNYRQACSINDGSSVVITGGVSTYNITSNGTTSEKKVTRYNLGGFVEDLQELNIARYDHACGGFNTESGARVGIHSAQLKLIML